MMLRMLHTDKRFKVLAWEFWFVSVWCRDVDADDAIFRFRSVTAAAAAAVAITRNTFIQSVDGDRATASTTVRRAPRLV
jgi:hypothetical protein